MSNKVAKNMVVELAFELFDAEKNLIDKAERATPMPYIHGAGQLLPSLEKALEGQEVNFATTVKLKADEAYGSHNNDLVVQLERSYFPEGADVKEGAFFNTEGPNGEPIVVEVVKVDDNMVTIDGNHPLAGLDLEYYLEVVGVREATKEEIEHGHVHASGESCGGTDVAATGEDPSSNNGSGQVH